MRPKNESEHFTPLPSVLNGRVECLLHISRQIEHASVNAEHERNAFASGDRPSNSTNPSQGMRVNDLRIFLAPKGSDQIERHQIPPDRDHLPASFRRNPPNRYECGKAVYFATTANQWVF